MSTGPASRSDSLPRLGRGAALGLFGAFLLLGIVATAPLVWHVDEALFPSTPPMRSDLSCTIFLNAPGDYDGGELTMQLGEQELAYKLEPGSALLYPSTTIHRVTPVTRGVRIAAITWLQSWIAIASMSPRWATTQWK